MSSAASIIICGLAIAAAVGAYLLIHSVLVSFLMVIVVYLICKNLYPFVSQWWQTVRPNRLPKLYEFRAKNLPATGERLGFRLIAMTEDLEPGPQTMPYYKKMAEEALEALSKESPLFELRLSKVREKNDPEQYVASLCGEDGKKMRKCLKAWIRSDALKNMQSQTQNRDLFIYDGSISVKDREALVPYTVVVLFDSSLPVSLPKPEESLLEAGKTEDDAT